VLHHSRSELCAKSFARRHSSFVLRTIRLEESESFAALNIESVTLNDSFANDPTRMKMAVFWDAEPCSLVDTDRRFRGDYCLH
jgi:hypothetical protein